MESCKSLLCAMREFCFRWGFFVSGSTPVSLTNMLTRYTFERIDISQLYQGESVFFFLFFFLFIYINDESRLRCGLERGV